MSALMTVGQLSRRTGLSHKSIRELEGRGLIYSAGRSESGYRLFDEDALWCVGAIGELRSLGLTIAEIARLHAGYLEDPELPSGPALAEMLNHAQERIRARIAADERTLDAIDEFRGANREMLAGASDFAVEDPCRRRSD